MLFAWDFEEFESRRPCGRLWLFPQTDGSHYDVIEGIAQRHANQTGVEVDIISCSRDEHGNIVGREREGLRVRPS